MGNKIGDYIIYKDKSIWYYSTYIKGGRIKEYSPSGRYVLIADEIMDRGAISAIYHWEDCSRIKVLETKPQQTNKEVL